MMHAKSTITPKPAQLLAALLGLTFFWALMQMAPVRQVMQNVLGYMHAMKIDIAFPWVIVPGLIGYISINILLWVAFAVLTWICSLYTAPFFRVKPTYYYHFAICLWLFFVMWVYMVNQYFFPYSQSALWISAFTPSSCVK